VRTGGQILPGGKPPPPGGRRVSMVPSYEAFEASSRDPEVRYRITCDGDGTWDCTCPGFENHGHCWHVTKHRVLAGRPPMVIAGLL